MLEQFRKFEIQKSNKIVGGNSDVGGDVTVKTRVGQGGLVNLAMGKDSMG